MAVAVVSVIQLEIENRRSLFCVDRYDDRVHF